MSSHPLFHTLSSKVNEKQRNKKVNMKTTQAIGKYSAVNFLESIYWWLYSLFSFFLVKKKKREGLKDSSEVECLLSLSETSGSLPSKKRKKANVKSLYFSLTQSHNCPGWLTQKMAKLFQRALQCSQNKPHPPSSSCILIWFHPSKTRPFLPSPSCSKSWHNHVTSRA